MALVWEELDSKQKDAKGKIVSDGLTMKTWRAKIPGGWLVRWAFGVNAAGPTFVPDPQHLWDGHSVP